MAPSKRRAHTTCSGNRTRTCFGDVAPVLLWFALGPCTFADVHGVRFHKAFEYRHSVGVPQEFKFWDASIERTMHFPEFCSSFGDHIAVFCVLGWFVEDLSFSVGVLRSGLFFDPACELRLFLFNRSSICILLEASSSISGNDSFQSILLGARLLSHHSNNRSACAGKRS